MDWIRWDALLEWIARHPVAAGAVIFLVAFCDALLIIGVAVPAAPILFAVGTLIGLGHIDGAYAVACAAAGAFCGDGVSYLAGRRYGDSLKLRWPFAQHPEWLQRGDVSFRRHGIKSLLIGRFVGAIRPFIPAIAGMLQMPALRYCFATGLAAVLWALAFLAPGWVFGASLDLVAAVAGRLAIVIGLLLLLIAAIWAIVFYLWRWLGPRAEGLLGRWLAWSHRHPVMGRYSEALIDPRGRESPALLVLSLALILGGWGFFLILASVGGGSAPSRLDLGFNAAMFGLRHPLADPLMGVLASLGDPLLLLLPVTLVFAWLSWRRQRIAAWHWLLAPAVGAVISFALGWLIDLPKPPAATAVAGYSFPAMEVTLATTVYGFFAVLIARELPGRNRVWPYVVGALLVGLLGFSRLYLGAHWLSDVLAGGFLGLLWTTALGIAYRRRTARAFWVKPVAWLFFGSLALMTASLAVHRAAQTVETFDPPLQRSAIDAQRWLSGDPTLDLPQRRNELRDRDAWPLNVQFAGDPAALSAQLQAQGWQVIEPGDWRGLLRMLDENASAETLPIMPATHRGHAEHLLLGKAGADPAERVVLRLWPAPYALVPGDTPLWLGSVHTLRFSSRGDGFVRYWSVQSGLEAPSAVLTADTAALQVPAVGSVLRLREPEPAP
ncbi:VTT domain-containing protein [Aquimonas sp.]|uniref:bifunctional DedA family/phosphatase PAP2 family protein n=1 Tax=Aquimonas sp. TaxID=1872588 RepID=UPI0037C1479C